MKTSNYTGPSEFFIKSIELAKIAIEHDKSQKYQEAFEYYKKTIEFLLEANKIERDNNIKEVIKNKTSEFLNRAEQIKQTLEEISKKYNFHIFF